MINVSDVALLLSAVAGGIVSGFLIIAIERRRFRRGLTAAIRVLRELDARQRALVEADGREPFWYEFRPRVERALTLPIGALDATRIESAVFGNGPVEEV